MTVTLNTALAAASALIAIAFGLSTWDRWLRRHRPHELAWTIAMAFFALAAFSLWWGEARGWSEPSFRIFFMLGAVINVPWLALGTIFLLAGPRAGRVTTRMSYQKAATCSTRFPASWLLWVLAFQPPLFLLERCGPPIAYFAGRTLRSPHLPRAMFHHHACWP
jgi:hypothetical protein